MERNAHVQPTAPNITVNMLKSFIPVTFIKCLLRVSLSLRPKGLSVGEGIDTSPTCHHDMMYLSFGVGQD